MKKARKLAEERGLKVRFFTGENLTVKDENGKTISARAYIKGNRVLVRADHPVYTEEQLMRHELGHDKIAKGEVDINKVRRRLEKTVGKENIDKVAKLYAEAYAGTGMTAKEIWEECICDSLGDMNVFAGEDAKALLDKIIPEVKKAASESKSENKTRGSPEGKASRERVPKRDKALYASGVYFLHKNFPPENERLSEAHRLATWWARKSDTEAGDRTLIFMNDVCYLVECFDDALNYYQVEDVVSKAEFDTIYKEIKKNGKVGQIKSILAAPNGYDSVNRQHSSIEKGKSGVDSNATQYGRESPKMVRLDRTQAEGRERSSSNGSRDSQSGGENKQKYSRELDTEYLAAVERGDMRTAQRMIDEAAKEAGYDKLFYHGAKKGGGFTEFRDWSYFTENKQYAERYTDRDKKSSLYTTYVQLKNPFDTRKKADRNVFNEIRQEYGLSELQDTGLPDWTDGYDISDYIDENELDYDGIILDEGGDLVDGKPVSRGLSYVIRKSAQIKFADPVTYDDDGNVIPLSERFNPQKSDIRFSRELDTEVKSPVDGMAAKAKAEYVNDRVFNKSEAMSAIRSINGAERLKVKEREALVDKLWVGLNAPMIGCY